MMEVPKDFQLLDDDDDMTFQQQQQQQPNQSQQMSTSFYDASSSSSAIRVQQTKSSSITVHSKISNSLNNLSEPSPMRPRSSTTNKFHISPNNPNANTAARLELKSTERPRSHSPLKMKGIEEYIQLYANSKAKQQASSHAANNTNKITMNLKMDDLLSNVKNDQYQTLSDFSFMTGDTDLVQDGNFLTMKQRRRSSLQNSNLKDDEWLRNKINNVKEFNAVTGEHKKENSLDIDADNDEDDDDNDDEELNTETNDTNNLNYKFTATYRKDETGSFKEQSKIVFESKQKPKPPVPPPPAPPSVAFNLKENSTTQNIEFNKTNSNYTSTSTAKQELANALEALYSNSKKLESKLDKLEDIRASSNIYVDATSSSALTPDLTDDDLKKMNNIFEPSVVSATTGELQVQPTQLVIKKKNDSFFNEFLTKSDDLIAQTQHKLEKLSKLETITKPLSASKPTNLPLDEKNKPASGSTVASPPQVVPEITTIGTTPNNEIQPQLINTTHLGSLNITSSENINSSKSLIDLKSQQQLIDQSNATSISSSDASKQTNAIDLLFDVNETSYSLTSEPLKQRESYFDLIGITRSESSNLQLQQQQQQNATNRSQTPSAIFNTTASSRSNSPFKDDLLDSLLGNIDSTATSSLNQSKLSNEILTSLYNNPKPVSSVAPVIESISEEHEPIKSPLVVLQQQDVESLPNIDILITEPTNEKDDNNIVPEGLFNIKHEIPYDQSRPHSPLEQSHSSENLRQRSPIQDIKSFMESPSSRQAPLPPSPSKQAPPPPPPPPPSAPLSPQSTSPIVEPPPKQLKEKPKRPVFYHSPEMIRSRPKSRPHSPPQYQNFTTTTTTTTSTSKTSKNTSSSTDLIDSIQSLNNGLEDDIFSNTNKEQTTTKMKKVKKKKQIKEIDLLGLGTEEGGAGAAAAESSSSSSEDDDNDDEIQKFQIRIRPKIMAPPSTSNSNNPSDIEPDTPDHSLANRFIPLLPRPPQSASEIEEFRKRRRSSGTDSITNRSLRGEQSSDEDQPQITHYRVERQQKTESNRKESLQSEFNLELPDADDSLPLSDFNDKCELTLYPDGYYGCMVLVRQPFRNPNLVYKNALQKITEVRTWTECLVKLVNAEPNGKKLVFYNVHELMTLASELETTVDKVAAQLITLHTKDENNNNEDPIEKRKIRPFHEIDLKASYKFSDMCLQQFDTYTKIHTFKMQEIIYKETFQIRPDRIMALPERLMKRFTKPKVTSLIDHTPLPIEICKFGHMNYSYLKSFLLLLQDAFWQLPTITRKLQREQQLQQLQAQPVTTAMSITAAATSLFSFGSNKQIQTPTLASVTTHAREEVTVKVVDEYKCRLDKECRILEHRSRTRVFLTVFINSPDPIIEIGLNDCLRHGKEIVSRHEIVPIKTEQWISPEIFELNENVVEKSEFEKTHCLRCVQMPDNLLVEIMRFRTRPRRNYELPLQVRCYMSLVERACEIRIECTVAGTYYTKLNEVHCEDIQIRFPLPDVWVYLFRVEKRFRYGAVHSSRHKFGKIKGLDRLLVHKGTSQGALMEASCGMAKYEQAFKSVVWRIEQLPVKNKDIYKTHLFICKFNLQEYDNLPDKYEPIAKVQYSIPVCASSKSQVRSISVNTCEEPPEKWVKLKSKFEYDLDINYLFDQKELPLVDKENCAELQHLTVTESEGDNNEEDDNDD